MNLAGHNHCNNWLQQHWKALIIILVVGLFVTVSVKVEERERTMSCICPFLGGGRKVVNVKQIIGVV